MSPVANMVTVPSFAIVAFDPPEVMLHSGVTMAWLYLATTVPVAPFIVVGPSITNWLLYDTTMVLSDVIPNDVHCIVNGWFNTPWFTSILPFWFMVA